MKKLLFAIIFLLLVIIFLLWYCNCRKGCKSCGTDNGKPGTAFCKAAECDQFNGEIPPGMINYRLAVRMSEDYERDNGKKYVWESDLRTDSLDGRSIWFDFKKMKQFIAYVEQSLCRNGCYDTTLLGIRFYYAKYPSVPDMDLYTDLDQVERINARKHTLFMVPTFWDPGKQKNIDFDPGQVRPNCLLVPIDSAVGSVPGRVWGAALRSADGGPDGQNHGSLMPPPASEGTFPTDN